jgi:hypothetical protein
MIEERDQVGMARLKEHIVDTIHNRISKYAIAEHSAKSKNLICFDQTKILASSPHYSSHLKHPNNFNREDGYKLIHSWKPTIYHLNH